MYRYHLTDDERRRIYQEDGHGWSNEKQIEIFGPRPWTWALESRHTNRNYRNFTTKSSDDNDDTYVGYFEGIKLQINKNRINGEERLHYRIPIREIRLAREHGRPYPSHPQAGDTLRLVSVLTGQETMIMIDANERDQTGTGTQRVTGTLRYH